MSAVREYLLSLVAVSLLTVLSRSLIPEGGVRRIASVICGLLLAICALSPLLQFDIDTAAQSIARIQMEKETLRTGVEVKNRELVSQIIKQTTQTYILDKAASMGLSVQAEVEMNDEGSYPYPYRVTLTGACTEAQRRQLARSIEENLGIPAERQAWNDR